MPERPAYHEDPYRRSLDTEVVGSGRDDAGPYVRLADTILYPEGGGQPADHGRVGGARVVDVRRVDGETRHYLDEALDAGPAAVLLDWARRFDHMQQHTAQHVLSALAQDRFGWRTTAFHLGEARSDLELDVPALSDADLAALEEAAAEVVRVARPITDRTVSPAEYEALTVRTRGLPDDHAGDVRLVEIDGVDLAACGGTHVRTTAELESIKLLGTEPMRGGTRLYYAAGRRVRRILDQHLDRAARLRDVLSAGDDALVETARQRVAQLRAAEKQADALAADLAEALARALLARPGRVVAAHLAGRDAKFAQAVARSLAPEADDRAVIVTAGEAGQGTFVLVLGPGVTVDLRQAGDGVAAALDGRGGGSRSIYQGRAGRLDGLDEATTFLERLLAG